MGIIGTILVGLIVGALARFVLPGEQKMGWILTILLGIGGSLLAGFVGQALGWYTVGEPAGWIMSVLGAVVLLVVVGKLRSPAADRGATSAAASAMHRTGRGGADRHPRPGCGRAERQQGQQCRAPALRRGSSSLPAEVKARLLALPDGRISADGVVVIKAQEHRSLEMNRADALARLQALVDRAAMCRACGGRRNPATARSCGGWKARRCARR